MKKIETLKNLFDNAKTDYRFLKQQIENEVVSWFWTSNDMFSLDPFWFEQNRYSKGKILKQEPVKNHQYAHQYGVNAKNEIIVNRGMTSFTEQFYETFYFRKDGEILSYHFDYGQDKEPINIKKYVYNKTQLTAIYAYFEENGHWIERFIYDNDKLIRKEWQGVDNYGNAFDRTITYDYDEIGQLATIKEGDYVWYQKPQKELSYKRLTELVQRKLIALLKENIQNHAPDEKLYCINLSYFGENMIPPAIGFGTESDRKQWLENEKHNNIIWNVADYSHQLDMTLDTETTALFDLFNQQTELNEKYSTAIKLIIECAKILKRDLQEFNLKTTDDFVVVAGYFDGSDLKKNFKQINPEWFEVFKKKLL